MDLIFLSPTFSDSIKVKYFSLNKMMFLQLSTTDIQFKCSSVSADSLVVPDTLIFVYVPAVESQHT